MTNLKQRNKVTAIFLSILMLFSVVATTLGTTGMSSSAATTTTLNMVDWYGLSHKSGTLANGTTIHSTDYFDIFGISGGKPAYCLEPGVQVVGGSSYTQVNDYIENHIDNNLTTARDKRNLISAIIQYAPEKAYGDVNDYCRYAAAQILIWEVLLEERDAQFNYVGPASGDAIMSLMRGEYLSQVKSDYNEIADAMKKRGLLPSFAGADSSVAPIIKLNQYDGTYFYRTIEDTNGVIGNFSFEANGVSFSVSGNNLTIKSKNMITDPIVASGTYTGDDADRTGLFFWNRSGYQAICSPGELTDPAPSAFIRIRTDIFGQIIVNKTSSNTSVTNGNNYYSFKGAQYRITGPL